MPHPNFPSSSGRTSGAKRHPIKDAMNAMHSIVMRQDSFPFLNNEKYSPTVAADITIIAIIIALSTVPIITLTSAPKALSTTFFIISNAI